MMHTAYIGLGSNLESPLQQVSTAIVELNEIPQTQVVSCSSWYQSVAVGPAQPDYINGVAKLSTSLTPLSLLDALQAIEQSHRRVRKEHWGPRTLDLDILLWDNDIITSERLTVPHPYLEARNFVILPLNDIQPDLILPNQKTISQLAQQCDTHGICRHTPTS